VPPHLALPARHHGIALAILLWATQAAAAGVFERNSVAGLWQLDDSLAARWACQPALLPAGFAIAGAPGPHFQPATPPRTWLNLGSASAPYGGLQPSEAFVLPNPAGANGPAWAAGTHEWTLILDVRFLSLPVWTAILQSDSSNSSDAEIFLNAAGELNCYGATAGGSIQASGPLATNTWYRLAVRGHYDAAAGNQVLRAYLNGMVTPQTAGNVVRAPLNGRYALQPDVLLFSDENGETARVDLGSVAFWGRALDDADIALIGASDTDGIDWPDITPANSCPPLPVLTGTLWFGSAAAAYAPDQAAVAASASAPSSPDAVATVQVVLGADGGSLPGLPQHRFGGTLTGEVLPNGEVRIFDTVALHYTGDGPDLGSHHGISLVRSGITLGPTGATAGTLRVLLPAGFGVATEPLGKRVRSRAVKSGVALDAALNPAATLSLTRADFTSDLSSSTLYPIIDRIPVRFATTALSYTPHSGRITFTPTEPLLYHREPQLGILLNQIFNGHPGAEIPASNELFFVAAKDASGPVRIEARPGGAAAIASMTITLDPLKFGGPATTVKMHHPALEITWTQPSGSQLTILNDAIDESSSLLAGATLAGSWYRQGVPDVDCAGSPGTTPPPTEEMLIQPDDAEWRFTRDGGLRAAGTVQAGAADPSPLTAEWGAYTQSTVQYHAHRISTGFTAARVLTGGVFARADQLTGLAAHEQVAALLFSGHGAPGDESRLERPGTTGYQEGLADYPGFNLRCAPGGFQAISRLADFEAPPYPLAAEAKYYLRPAGVTGRHLSAAGAPDIQFSAYGAVFNVSSLNLAFLDGANVASGVAGSLDVPPPADFDLAFKHLMFGGQGQLKEAAVFTPQADKVLGPAYWGLEFTPLALEFPQPKTCPKPGPGEGFVKVLAKATLSGLGNHPLAGNISVLNGNLVTEADPEAKGHSPVSSFAPGTQIAVTGPAGGGSWIVHPATRVSINKHPSAPNGTLCVGGLMDLPFFTDMPVLLSTNSTNQTAQPPDVFVRKPWVALETTPYDPEHTGLPAGVSLADFRTGAGWDPHAARKWQGVLSFDFPLQLGADRVFRSRVPVGGDVILFHLTQAVASMSPAAAELTFDGSAALDMNSLIPQVNVAKLLQDSGLPGLSGGLQGSLDGALEAVAGLDALLADQVRDLLDPGLTLAAGGRADSAFFSALAAAPNRSAKLDELTTGLTADVTSLLGSGTGGLNGKWRRDLLAEITAARQGVQAAQALVASTANLQQLAGAVGGVIGVGGTPAAVPAVQLAALQSSFAQVVERLQQVETALGGSGDLTTALSAALGGSPAITAVVQQAVNDLKPKWGGASDAVYQSAGAAQLAADLADALTDRYAGAAFAGSATMLLRQYAGDPQTLARQALDDTLRAAEQLVAAALNDAPGALVSQALGSAAPGELPLGDFLAAARLRGYARINGDALHELRLDGQARLKVPDEMKFDAWFLLRDVDSTTPGGACLAAGGAATEIGMGANAMLEWAGKKVSVGAGGKVAVSGTGSPVAFAGDLALDGSFDFSEVEVNNIKLGFGFGANNGYLYGRAAGQISAMSVEAGIFVGQTCDTAVIANADDDIGALLDKVLPGFTLPVRGAMVYAEGGMSLMPLIGVPPSCVLDLRLHGGQGYFGFFNSGGQVVAGVKQLQGVSGELLCLANASGKFATVLAGTGTVGGGGAQFDSLNGSTSAKLKGKVGVGYFSYTFTKTIRLHVSAAPLDYSLDY
jgi:hypothetical protein